MRLSKVAADKRINGADGVALGCVPRPPPTVQSKEGNAVRLGQAHVGQVAVGAENGVGYHDRQKRRGHCQEAHVRNSLEDPVPGAISGREKISVPSAPAAERRLHRGIAAQIGRPRLPWRYCVRCLIGPVSYPFWRSLEALVLARLVGLEDAGKRPFPL